MGERRLTARRSGARRPKEIADCRLRISDFRFGIWDLRFGIWPLGFGISLSVFFALALAQIVSTSPTFDEGFTLLRGYAAWRTGHLIPLGHPPLAYSLSALGVTLEPDLPDPRTLTGWANDEYDDASRNFLWQRGLNAGRIVFLGRYPILLLGVLLGALTARWAKDLFGWRGGLLSLALHAFSPNLLAHSAVATRILVSNTHGLEENCPESSPCATCSPRSG